MTGWERALAFARELWQAPEAPALIMLRAYGRALNTIYGGTHDPRYEQHRANWMRTGERIWLDRMLRHLEPED